jgi:hypothetical protein
MTEGQPIIVDRNGDGKFTDEEDGKYYTKTPHGQVVSAPRFLIKDGICRLAFIPNKIIP